MQSPTPLAVSTSVSALLIVLAYINFFAFAAHELEIRRSSKLSASGSDPVENRYRRRAPRALGDRQPSRGRSTRRRTERLFAEASEMLWCEAQLRLAAVGSWRRVCACEHLRLALPETPPAALKPENRIS